MHKRYEMQAGEKLWNGYTVNQYEADIYNQLSNKINDYINAKMDASSLMIERHNFFTNCLSN
jgi:hypothetical protein